MRGGGKNASQAKKAEGELLKLLQDVLIEFKNNVGNGSPPVMPSSSSVDAVLLGALQRLVERASKNPAGLLDRLTSLVNLAKSGQLRAPGPKKPSESPKPDKPASGAVASGGNQAKGKGKGKGKGKEQGNLFKLPLRLLLSVPLLRWSLLVWEAACASGWMLFRRWKRGSCLKGKLLCVLT